MYQLSREEQETGITFNAAEQKAWVDTIDPVMIRKLDALCEAFPDVYHFDHCDNWGTKFYVIDNKKLIRFGRPLTEEQRRKRQEHATRMNSQGGTNSLQRWREAQKNDEQ